MSPSPGHNSSQYLHWVLIQILDDSLLAQVAHDFSPKSSIILLPLESPCSVSLLLLLPSEWDGSGGEKMFIAQKMSGHFWDLANKACTEWWCVWQYYCAKNNLV